MFLIPAVAAFSAAPVTVIRSDAGQLILECASPAVKIEQTIVSGVVRQRIKVPAGENLLRLPGFPEIPFVSFLVAIPPQGNISLKVVFEQSEEISQIHLPLAPDWELVENEFGGYIREIPGSVPKSGRIFPEKRAEIADIQMMRGVRVAKIHLYPYQYLASEKLLRHDRKMRVYLSFPAAARKTTSAIGQRDAFAPLLRRAVVNYDAVKNWIRLPGKENFQTAIRSSKFLTPGNSFKLLVSEDGLYQLTKNDLQQAGFPVAETDPRKIHLFFRGEEVPLRISGEDDASFDDDDVIQFWGERNRSDSTEFFDAYSDTSVYWLVPGDDFGKRFLKQPAAVTDENLPEKTTFRRTLHFEKDLLYYQGDKGYAPDTKHAPGEGWIWKYFYPGDHFEFYFTAPAIDVAADSACRIKFRLRGITIDPASPDHQVQIELNGNVVSEFQFDDQEEVVKTIEVPASAFKAGNNLWRLTSQQTAAEINKIYFDWLEIDYPATTALAKNWFPFQVAETETAKVNLWNQTSQQFSVFNLSKGIELTDFKVDAEQRYVIHLYSAGFDDGNWCKIEINGEAAIDGGHRGHNIVVLDTLTGQIEDKLWFDTLDKTENSDSMAAYIGRIPEGKIVLVAIRDEGSYRMTEAAYQALESLGSALTRQVQFRDSYVLLGRKGASPGTVPEVLSPQHQGAAELTDTLTAHQPGSYAVQFQAPFQKGDTWLVVGVDSVKKPVRIVPFSGTNLRAEGNQAEYIFIAHKKFHSVAQQLANFWQQRGMSTFIADVDDIYDEFNFGIKNPTAIKEFLKYAYQNWQRPAPTYVLLVGDASWDAKKNISTSVKEDYVPSWGNPVSDIWYVCLDGDDDRLPEMFIGRLPIETVEQGTRYLQKMIDYENYPSARWKKQICFINGGFDDQEQYIFGYQTDEIVKDFVIPPPAALQPTIISKELDGLYEGEKREEIIRAIDDGKVWVNFIGHGGSGTWELMFHDQQVFQLENQGKLPLVSSFTCHTGRFANPQITNFGENFILYSEAGAIAFIGTTGWGFIYEDDIMARALFRSVLSDTVRNFGAALTLAKIRFWGDVFKSNRAEDVFLQYSLLGDPALSFTLPDKPDLTVTADDVAISPENPVEADSLISIDATVENFGLAAAESVDVKLTDIFAFGGPDDIFAGKIAPVRYQQTISVPFSIAGKAGEHTVALAVDPANTIEEADEGNNQASRTFSVGSSRLAISRPAPNMILPADQIALQVYAPADSGNARYFFQVNTADSFENPLLNSGGREAGAFVAQWQISLPDTGKVYFWRCQKNYSGTAGVWVDGDFFVGNRFGWGQFVPEQMKKDNLQKTKITSAGISLATEETIFRVESGGYDDLNYAVLFVNSTPVSTSGRGHNVAVCDPYGEFVEFRHFDTHASAEDVAAMVDFLDSVPHGYFVLAGIRDSGAQQMTEEAYQALEQIGSQYCREVGFRDSWAIIGKKGASIGSVPEKFVQRFGGVAVVEDTLVTFAGQGSLATGKIGPAVKWRELDFNAEIAAPNGELAISIYGFNKKSFQWDLLKSNLPTSPVSLDEIDATNYAYLKLSADLASNDRFHSPLLKNWQVFFEPAPDLAVSEKTVSVSPQRIIQGGEVTLTAEVHNIGYVDADSVAASVYRVNSQGERELVANKLLEKVKKNNFAQISMSVPVIDEAGEQNFLLQLDPQEKITELAESNNQVNLSVFVEADTLAPRLEVTFDGQTIVDGDYVAQKPVIEVRFFDNSPFDMSGDTSHIHLFLDGERVSFGEQENMARIYFESENSDSTLKARVRLIREFTDGNHVFDVYATDVNKNTSHVENNFSVISKLALLNVFNYPNPFSTSTRFTFHLTQPAERVTIKIFTTGGRLINQLEKLYCEAGYHQIEWDGRDGDGDEIANGVYLYKIIAKNKDERAEKIEKCAIVH